MILIFHSVVLSQNNPSDDIVPEYILHIKTVHNEEYSFIKINYCKQFSSQVQIGSYIITNFIQKDHFASLQKYKKEKYSLYFFTENRLFPLLPERKYTVSDTTESLLSSGVTMQKKCDVTYLDFKFNFFYAINQGDTISEVRENYSKKNDEIKQNFVNLVNMFKSDPNLKLEFIGRASSEYDPRIDPDTAIVKNLNLAANRTIAGLLFFQEMVNDPNIMNVNVRYDTISNQIILGNASGVGIYSRITGITEGIVTYGTRLDRSLTIRIRR